MGFRAQTSVSTFCKEPTLNKTASDYMVYIYARRPKKKRTAGNLEIFEGSVWKGDFLRFHMGVSRNRGTPKSSMLIGFSLINHPFWGTPIFGNTLISSLFKMNKFTSHAFKKKNISTSLGGAQFQPSIQVWTLKKRAFPS